MNVVNLVRSTSPRTGLASGMAAFALLFPLMVAAGDDATTADPRAMKFDPVEFTPPEPDRVVLENGMVVYLLEDHELPLITLSATLRTGAWLDPAEKVGLAAITGTAMRTGGGGTRSAEQVDQELEQFAADVGIAIGRLSGSASLDVLSKDFKRGLDIFAGLLRSPPSSRLGWSSPSFRRSRASGGDRTIPVPSSAASF